MVALHADRLSHRRRLAVLTDYFEHVLQLPQAYHGVTHSGRLLKVMLTGTDTLWALWLAFFRDHLVGFVSLIILLPLSLFLNWRLASLLIVLCLVFAVLMALVLRRTEGMQRTVEQHYTEMAERTTDTLGNIALVQSFARIEAEVSALKHVVNQLLGAQMPVLTWWAALTVLTRTATTVAILAIIILGTWLHLQGLASIGEIVTFMAIATMVIQRLEFAVGFVNRVFVDAPRLADFFEVLDTTLGAARPAECDRSRPAVRPGRVQGRLVLLRRQAAGGDRSEFHRAAGTDHRAGRSDRRRQVDGACAAAPGVRSAVGRDQDRRHGHPRHQACRRFAATSAWCSRRRLLFNRPIARNFARNGGVDMVEGLAALLPDYFHAFGPAMDLDFGATDKAGRPLNKRFQFGNMVLSRWPIVASRNLLLPRTLRLTRGNLQRSALEALVMAPLGADQDLFRPSRPRQRHRARSCRSAISRSASLPMRARAARSPARPNTAFPNRRARKRSSCMGDFNMDRCSPEYVLMTGEQRCRGEAGADHPVDVYSLGDGLPDGAVSWVDDAKPETNRLIDFAFVEHEPCRAGRQGLDRPRGQGLRPSAGLVRAGVKPAGPAGRRPAGPAVSVHDQFLRLSQVLRSSR